jgi:hypothetical protein
MLIVWWVALVLLAVVAVGLGGLWYTHRMGRAPAQAARRVSMASATPSRPRPAPEAAGLPVPGLSAQVASLPEHPFPTTHRHAIHEYASRAPMRSSAVSVPAPAMFEAPFRAPEPVPAQAPRAMKPPVLQTARLLTTDDSSSATANSSSSSGTTTSSQFQKRTRTVFRYVDQNYYNAATGILTVPVDLSNCVGLELWEASIPRTHYIVEAAYSTFVLYGADDAEGNNPKTFDVNITPGDYNITTLVTELTAQLAATANVEDAGVFASTYATVSISSITKKLTFARAVGKFIALEFGAQHLAHILGFGKVSAYTPPENPYVADDFSSTSLYWPARSVATVVKYATGDVVAPFPYDLGGSRYLRIEADALTFAYGDSSVIKDLAYVGDISFYAPDFNFMREFIDPVKLGRVSVAIKVRMPDTSTIAFDNKATSFYLTFAVTVLALTRDRTSDPIVD